MPIKRLRSGSILPCLAALMMSGATMIVPAISHAALSGAEIQWVKAEARSPASAAAIYKQMLAGGNLPKSMSEDQLRLALVEALLKQAETQFNVTYLKEVGSVIAGVKSPSKRFWAMLMAARTASDQKSESLKNKYISAAEAQLASLSDATERSYGSESLVRELLRGAVDGDDIIRAKKWIDSYVHTAWHESSARHQVAVAELRMTEPSLLTLKKGQQKTKFTSLMKRAIQDKRLADAGRYAHAMPLSLSSDRKKMLTSLAEAFQKAGDGAASLSALSGISNSSAKSGHIADLVEQLLKTSKAAEAEHAVKAMTEMGKQASSWIQIAKFYDKRGYSARAEQAVASAKISVEKMQDGTRKSDRYAALTKLYAEMGLVDKAAKTVMNAQGSAKRPDAMVSIIKFLTEKRSAVRAESFLEPLESHPDEYAHARALVARAYAREENPDKAGSLLSGLKIQGTSSAAKSAKKAASEAWSAVAKFYVGKGMTADADDAIKKIGQGDVKAKTLIYYGGKMAGRGKMDASKALYKNALMLIRSVSKADRRDTLLVEWAVSQAKYGNKNAAQSVLKDITSSKGREKVKAVIAGKRVKNGELDAGLADIKSIASTDVHDEALTDLAKHFVAASNIESAIAATRAIREPLLRTRVFHHVAKVQASYTDFYGVIDKKNATVGLSVDVERTFPTLEAELERNGATPTKKDVALFAHETRTIATEKKNDAILREPISSDVGLRLPSLGEFKERINLTVQDVRSKVPATTATVINILSIESTPFNHKFLLAMGRSGFAKLQQNPYPDVIYIERGVADIHSVYQTLKLKGLGEDYLSYNRNDGSYTLRRPIIVGPDAAFTVTGADTPMLKMSQERGAFIVNAGLLYIVDTHVVGWNETEKKPAMATYADKYKYRPFITAWSESDTQLAGSVFKALGYANAKSYGLSFSSGPKDMITFRHENIERPKGNVIANSFDNMYYGFYSYEADHISIVGNEYVDNIVYGVDPHDRSNYLTIAYNTAYLAQKKHGIIISREVNYSIILGNLSFENKGSGFMIDRLSTGSMIYANTGLRNKQDGLTIFESSCKMIASNRFIHNERTGLKIRNATDVGVFYNVVANNRGSGIEGYISDLRQGASHLTRDFELDPYSDITALTMVGNWIEKNDVGLNVSNASALYLRQNQYINQSPKIMRGTTMVHAPEIMKRFNLSGKGAFMTKRCPAGRVVIEAPCQFRDNGFLDGDGQGDLPDRILANPCIEEAGNEAQRPLVLQQKKNTSVEKDDHSQSMADEERK